MVTRRELFKYTAIAGAAAGAGSLWASKWGLMEPGLAQNRQVGGGGKFLDSRIQPKFVNTAPNALEPTFKYIKGENGKYRVQINAGTHNAGIIDQRGRPLTTPIFGYGDPGTSTWPGKTFEIQQGDTMKVVWENNLGKQHLVPVDTSLHWCYSLPGYTQRTIAADGVPIITHLHGGHSDYQFDGNPEFFYTPGSAVKGPAWSSVPGGFTNEFVYDTNVPAGNLWYHDHALGITRSNVAAGMAGFCFIRDGQDTGTAGNSLNLPAYPYELAYAIQDRMFTPTGQVFVPAFRSDPYWNDFIRGKGNTTTPQPSVLTEFFGNMMLVNGKVWPKTNVEPRQYRLRLLNGCDSRFLVIRFRAVAPGATDLRRAGAPLLFHVIGSDQGLASSATQTNILVIEPGGRYDVIFDFGQPGLNGQRVILENFGGDFPFGGLVGNPRWRFSDTDRIMAFDVLSPLNSNVPNNFNPRNFRSGYARNSNTANRVRKVALFEALDEFGRLQPLLGTAEQARDFNGKVINWPTSTEYVNAGLTGPMEGAIAWHSPTTENPKLGDTEIWEIYNATVDAHPVHLHLVNFEVLNRQAFTATVVPQAVVQHNRRLGQGAKLTNIQLVGGPIDAGSTTLVSQGYIENAPKDMVTARPGEVTRIKVTFDKPGEYVWHCHLLSHEDHEMMRRLHVGPGA